MFSISAFKSSTVAYWNSLNSSGVNRRRKLLNTWMNDDGAERVVDDGAAVEIDNGAETKDGELVMVDLSLHFQCTLYSEISMLEAFVIHARSLRMLVRSGTVFNHWQQTLRCITSHVFSPGI